MSQEGLVGDWDEYLVVLREDAHQLLAWGYADTRSQLPKARDEYDITDWIAAAMARRIENPKTPERFTLYAIHNERPIKPAGEHGKDRPKLDIQIERCGIRPKRYYTFEAKRLRDDSKASVSNTLKHYLGEDGVGRFVSGRYESESIEAAMLGCIQAHDADFWIGKIGAELLEDTSSGNNKFGVIKHLKKISIIVELPNEVSSVHQRKDGSKIQLLHIFISCK